ncbi:MAG: ImmA/IrrE family metallo-endopeptidase [Eubacteriales bacterium]|nr:ImmA/IrrE family metallo-endopeptidase [Eubacteriales bacterium]MDZ4042107.1 ImmA/IrrE family metallo-endopeptidase [Eubacteriales bacterium]
MAIHALINKETLRAVCEAKKVTCAYIAKETKYEEDRIVKWSNPSDALRPTFVQAKKIAKCLHVPFAGLYMKPVDVPLRKLPTIKSYRTFPNGFIEDDSSLNIAISDLLQARDFLVKTKEELGETLSPFSVTINSRTDDVLSWADEIRRVFDLNLDAQFRAASMRQFYLYVREKIESKGIFIHCFSDVDLDIARGIALYDDKTPIIGINEEDRFPAKTFSIIHELIHLLKRQSSLCNEMFNAFSSNQEEVFCNAIAGEVLVPQDALKVVLKKWKTDEVFSIEDIQEIAKRFSVSKEVILRRLLDIGRIKNPAYTAYIDEYRWIVEQERAEQKLARQEGRSSGFAQPPDSKAIDRTSSVLCITLYKGYSEELFSKQDVSRYLGIGQQYINRFLQEVSSWHS